VVGSSLVADIGSRSRGNSKLDCNVLHPIRRASRRKVVLFFPLLWIPEIFTFHKQKADKVNTFQANSLRCFN
jgi:hypothetical protein